MIIGIDLGTTHCVAACLRGDATELIPNALGEILTPSIVGIDPSGELLVGRAAGELQVVRPDRCASLFKRHMGSDWKTTIDGVSYTPEKLSSVMLAAIRADAEAHLRVPVHRAVVTVPAYFNEHQRKATIHAGQIAGLQVERILNEPTAAAIAYGLHESEEDKVIVVFDLGGGTFDVSIVDMFEGTLEVRASSGETFLGGEDFTSAMANRLLQSRGLAFEHAEFEHPLLVSRLRLECETAKRRLSRETETSVRIPETNGAFGDAPETVTLSRSVFESWTEHLLGRCEVPIRRALGDASLKRTDVDEVILVGGATRMPAVSDRVTDLFGRPPRCSLNPDEVVALGAAIQGGLIARNASVDELVVTDVAPFTLGVDITRKIGGRQREGYFCPIINRNTTIPVSRVERVATTAPNQTTVNVRIFQGESRRVENNIYLGEFDVHGIPRGPAGQEVDIRFTYDLNGVLEVEAVVVSTKKKVNHIITRHARGLSDAEVAEAVREMEALKTHPREEAANRFLIRRTERLYEELPLFARDELSLLIHGFEEALELGDPAVIEQHRDELTQFLERFDPQDPEADEDDERSW